MRAVAKRASGSSRRSRCHRDGLVARRRRASRLQLGAGVRALSTYNGHYDKDPTLTREAATGAFPLPYGFGSAYTAEYNRVLFVLDTRVPRSSRGPGLRVEAQAEQGSEVQRSPASAWVRYAVSAGGYLDLNQRGRVLGLAITTLFVDPLGDRPVPSLGGDGPMRGYYPGRLVDRSAAAAARILTDAFFGGWDVLRSRSRRAPQGTYAFHCATPFGATPTSGRSPCAAMKSRRPRSPTTSPARRQRTMPRFTGTASTTFSSVPCPRQSASRRAANL